MTESKEWMCSTCKKPAPFKAYPSSKRQFCGKECYWASLRGIKDKKGPNWRPVVSVRQAHLWLDVHYGQPKICEGTDCRGSQYFDWALIHGKNYERKRENFYRLCRSCHRRYDITEKEKQAMIGNFKWFKQQRYVQ